MLLLVLNEPLKRREVFVFSLCTLHLIEAGVRTGSEKRRESCYHTRLSEAGYLISANAHQLASGLKQGKGSFTGLVVLLHLCQASGQSAFCRVSG